MPERAAYNENYYNGGGDYYYNAYNENDYGGGGSEALPPGRNARELSVHQCACYGSGWKLNDNHMCTYHSHHPHSHRPHGHRPSSYEGYSCLGCGRRELDGRRLQNRMIVEFDASFSSACPSPCFSARVSVAPAGSCQGSCYQRSSARPQDLAWQSAALCPSTTTIAASAASAVTASTLLPAAPARPVCTPFLRLLDPRARRASPRWHNGLQPQQLSTTPGAALRRATRGRGAQLFNGDSPSKLARATDAGAAPRHRTPL